MSISQTCLKSSYVFLINYVRGVHLSFNKIHEDNHMAAEQEVTASLDEFRIKDLPADAFYVADFITAEEEHKILEKVHYLTDNKDIVTDYNRYELPPNLAGKYSAIDDYRPGLLN